MKSSADVSYLRQWEKHMRQRVDKRKLPGYTCAVYHHGELIHSDSYGYADESRKTRWSPDTIVRLYCATKSPVAIAVLMLHERGALNLSDPVSKYIPSFKQVGIVANASAMKPATGVASPARGVSLVRLMTHSAGLGYGPGFGYEPQGAAERSYACLGAGVESGDIDSIEKFCDALAELPLRETPGKKYTYSFGLDVLGRVVEVASGKSLAKFLEDELFRPLGMRDTGFSVPRRKVGRLAALYCNRDRAAALGELPKGAPTGKDALLRVDGARAEESAWVEGRHCRVYSGGGIMGKNAGGLVSTLRDFSRFALMLANGGTYQGRRYLSEATVQRYCMEDVLTQPSVVGRKQRDNGKSFGWNAIGELGIKLTKRDAWTQDDFEETEVGMGGAACTYWSINPSRGLVTLWFTQSIDNDTWVKEDENYWAMARKAVPKKPQQLVKKKVQKTIANPPRWFQIGIAKKQRV